MPFKDQEKKKQYQHQYYFENRDRNRNGRQTEEYRERRKQYALANKSRLDVINKEKFECGCGGCYTRHNKSTHEKAKMHIEWINRQPQANQQISLVGIERVKGLGLKLLYYSRNNMII